MAAVSAVRRRVSIGTSSSQTTMRKTPTMAQEAGAASKDGRSTAFLPTITVRNGGEVDSRPAAKPTATWPITLKRAGKGLGTACSWTIPRVSTVAGLP